MEVKPHAKWKTKKWLELLTYSISMMLLAIPLHFLFSLSEKLTVSEAESVLNTWTMQNKPTIEVYTELKDSVGKTLVDKSPLYAYNLPTMQNIQKF